MVERISKVLLLAAIALFFSLAVLNNITDYSTNFAFVQHILSMDTIFPESHLHWRAITAPALHHVFYWAIIIWEIATAGFCWTGVVRLVQAISAIPSVFQAAKFWGLVGLTASIALWLGAFLCIGGEWFAMWQSPVWNGQPIAFRMFTISGIALLLLCQPDASVGDRK